MSMRTQDLEDQYKIAREDGSLKTLYDEDPIHDFKYWRIVANRFPHNKLTDVNHIIVLKRPAEDIRHIGLMEWIELLKIVWFIRRDYDVFTYNLPSMSSIKNIPHCHLYKLKEEYK